MSVEFKTYPNPDNRKNWLIKVEILSPAEITVRFIPDKLLIDHKVLKSLMTSHALKEYKSPEVFVLNLIEVINNELIPKWLEVVHIKDGVTIKIEDWQPGHKDLQFPSSPI